MIQFNRFQLKNGLRVLVHEDPTTPMASVNLLYDVGARDESIEQTGFAHLFEHLMFGGSKHVEDFDEPLQLAGGESNAFTSNDITNFYDILPANNLETAFWLESDRMMALDFSQESLDVQKKVVIEEFKENYINQPYGDVWHKVRSMAYTTHPYQWPTIGLKIEHIADATLKDVESFFYKHYRPSNAILVVGGGVKTAEIEQLSNKWFGDIPAGEPYRRLIAPEPIQTSFRSMDVEADVAVDAIYIAFHCCDRYSSDYFATDFLTDILAMGRSSRFYQQLVMQQQLFSNISAYSTDSMDKSLFIVYGKVMNDKTMEAAEAAIWEILDDLKAQAIDQEELTKLKNKMESQIEFSEASVLSNSINLAYYELLGDASEVNEEVDNYLAVSTSQLQDLAKQLFVKENCSTLYYRAKKQ